MVKELEKQIRDLQKELAEVQRQQAALRLLPCMGDSEIRKKQEKFDELDGKVKNLEKTIRDLTKKRLLFRSRSNAIGSCGSPDSGNSL